MMTYVTYCAMYCLLATNVISTLINRISLLVYNVHYIHIYTFRESFQILQILNHELYVLITCNNIYFYLLNINVNYIIVPITSRIIIIIYFHK